VPVIHEIHPTTVSQLCIWQITETVEELLQMADHEENLFLENNKSLLRQQQLIAMRLLLSKMTGDNVGAILIDYDENGKPHLTSHKIHISISHTKEFVAVHMHKEKMVGVDLEIITPRIEKISERFLSDEENSWLKPESRLQQLYIIWSAKECAFKIQSQKGISFKEMLQVKQFDFHQKGSTEVEFKKNNVLCTYPVQWEMLNNDLLLVYGFNPG
jgi:4'-phosphopantetheinyl transferase